MRIKVQHENGATETLDLEGPLTVIKGHRLDRIRDSHGFEHFFTKDGFYDGWGARLPKPNRLAADRILDALEEKRSVEVQGAALLQRGARPYDRTN